MSILKGLILNVLVILIMYVFSAVIYFATWSLVKLRVFKLNSTEVGNFPNGFSLSV